MQGQRDPDSEAAERGQHFHAMGKLYVDFLVSSEQESDWSYADEVANSQKWNLEAMVIFRDWSRRRTFNPRTVFATEYQIRLNWDLQPVDDDDPDVVFAGDIDLLEISGNEAIVGDYKTHFGVFEPTTIQSIYYPWLLFQIMPTLDKITFNLEFVRWGANRSKEFTRDQLPEMNRYVQNQVIRLAGAVASNEWPATVNSKCVYCHLQCPLVDAGLTQESIGQVQNQARAVELANQMFALDAASAKIQASLRAWAIERGTIDAGNDMKLGFFPSTKYTHDPRTITKLNKDHGFDPIRALQVNNQEIKKIARQYPEYVEAAKKTAKNKTSTTFRFWNAGGDPLDNLNDEEE